MTSHTTFLAPAKLNLFLHIVGRRDDGYHNLQTLFQLLDFGDEIEITPNTTGDLTFTCTDASLSGDDNLVMKAARLLQTHTDCRLGAHLHLHKNLPAGGGIGGGSSDAATTLVALNYLWQQQLGKHQLLLMAKDLGADVPVFVNGYSAFAEGIGEQLQALDLPEKWYVVLAPDCHVSTAEIFSHKGLTRDTPVIKVAASFEQGTKNDCQALVCELYPQVRSALNWLSQFGEARMTGTGACVFLGVNDKHRAQAIFNQKPQGVDGFVARGVNRSPMLSLLAK